MKKILCFFLIFLVFSGCKKSTNNNAPADYSCDCSKYGMNLINFMIDHPIGLFPFRNESNKWGYIDAKNNVIIKPSFKVSYPFSHARAMVYEESSYNIYAGFINPSGEYAIPANYNDFYLYFSKEGVIPFDVTNFSWGFMDQDGKLVISGQYSDASQFHEGLAVVGKNNHYGAIDITGIMLVPNHYLVLGTFSERKACAGVLDSLLGYIGSHNQSIIPPLFAVGGIFVNGLAVVADPALMKYGYIDSIGNYRIDPKFQDANPFWENLAAIRNNNKWGFIDNSGQVVINPVFDDVLTGFCEDLAGVKINGKWGYVDKAGNIVIPTSFKDADVFYCGLAYVIFQDDCFGYIDKSGNTIWKSLSPFLDRNKHNKIIDVFHNNFSEKVFIVKK